MRSATRKSSLIARFTLALCFGAAWGIGLESSARASNVTEVPDNGSEQMGRGGAWVARASDPLATIFNPAGLAGQPTRLTLQNNFIIHDTCFTRLKAAGDSFQDGALVDASGHYPEACNDSAATFNPQFGATIALSDRLGLGLLVIGPATAGERTWPDFVKDANGEPAANPGRYLMARQSGIILNPTVGIGYEAIPGLRIGASLSWGLAKIKQAAAVVALNTDGANAANDIRANIQVADYFVPGFTLGALWSATPELDVAGWYKWTDAIRARGDVGTAANFYTKQNAGGDDKNVRYGDTIYEDCGTGLPADAGKCGAGDNARIKLTLPMEAKLGLRYHKPRVRSAPPQAEEPNKADVIRDPAAPKTFKRDPLANDVFDVELDLTWANNSAIDSVEVRFPGDSTGRGLLPVSGVQGGEVPPNADQVKQFRDVLGVRFGGDVNVLPDRLAIRAGTFFETSALNERYQNIDFAATSRFGLALGGTYRIRFGDETKSSALEIMVGYGHVFFAKQEREDRNADGLGALAGTSCNGSDPDPNATGRCLDGSERYRTKWPVNLGTITNTMNVINVGLAYRF